MSAEVWYRKWRPQTFAEVSGQQHVTQTLARAVANDRVAHAYVFCGPRGTGKTSTARILAKAVNCEANVEGQPCTVCESCIAVTEGRALDLIEMDAASNRGIDEIRGLRDKVGYSPNSSRYKVYLIDEAHELTTFAFDALLKTLEEPPPHVIFIFATTEAHKLPETILSRCQRFDFQRIKLADVVARMRQVASYEGIDASDDALEIIARRATGSLRDALNQFEQIVAAQGQLLTEANVRQGQALAGDQRAASLVEMLLERRLADSLNLIALVRDDGADLRQFTGTTVQYLRSVLLVRAGAEASLSLSDEAVARLRQVAEHNSVPEVLRAARALTGVDFRADPQSPLPLELAVIEFIEGAEAGTAVAATSTTSNDDRRPDARQPRPVAAAPATAAAPASAPADRVRSALAPRSAPPPPLRGRPAAPNGIVATPAPVPVTAPPEVHSLPIVAAAPDASSAAAVSAAADQGPTASMLPEDEPASVPASVTPLPLPVAPMASPAQNNNGAMPEDEVLTLEQAQRKFRLLYERCGEIDKGAARVLNGGGCDIVEISAGMVTIGFKYPKMVEMASGVNDAALRKSVIDIFGAEYAVRYVLVENVPSRLQLLAAEQPSHLLDEALKLGAKPVGRAQAAG